MSPPHYLLTPWSRVLLEKLTGSATSQEIPRFFLEPEGSSPYSQVPATCPYPEPVTTRYQQQIFQPTRKAILLLRLTLNM